MTTKNEIQNRRNNITQNRTTVSKTNNDDAKPTQQANRPTLHSGECSITNANGNPPAPQKGGERRRRRRRQRKTDDNNDENTKTKPYLQTPIKPHSTHKTAERLQKMTPNKKHHKTKRGTHIKIGKLTVTQNRTTHITNQNQTHNNRRKQTMTTEAQIWKKINEPKIEGLITNFDKNGKPTYVFRILDRIPKITRKRR